MASKNPSPLHSDISDLHYASTRYGMKFEPGLSKAQTCVQVDPRAPTPKGMSLPVQRPSISAQTYLPSSADW